MKTLLTLLSFLFYQNFSFCQPEFAPEGAEWCYYTYEGGFFYDGYMHLEYIGDTLVKSKLTKILKSKRVLNFSDESYFTYLIHQSNDSIYEYIPSSDEFVYIFRNQATIGESVFFYHAGDVLIENAEGIPFGIASINKYVIKWPVYPYYTELYDRAGPAYGFFDIWTAPAFDGPGFRLRWYKDNRISHFQASEGKCEDLLTSIKNNIHTDLAISPNPVSDLIYCKIPFNSDDKIAIKIFDLNGRFIKYEKLNNGELNVEHLAPGMYVLVIEVGVKKYRQKLVKK